jgi:hypothetical protein
MSYLQLPLVRGYLSYPIYPGIAIYIHQFTGQQGVSNPCPIEIVSFRSCDRPVAIIRSYGLDVVISLRVATQSCSGLIFCFPCFSACLVYMFNLSLQRHLSLHRHMTLRILHRQILPLRYIPLLLTALTSFLSSKMPVRFMMRPVGQNGTEKIMFAVCDIFLHLQHLLMVVFSELTPSVNS